MKQAKKGNERHFGMKAHVGADAGTGMAHTLTFTAASTHDIGEAHKLVRRDDGFANGDAGYVGTEKREEAVQDKDLNKIQWRISKRKGKDRAREEKLYKEAMGHLDCVAQPCWDKQIEYLKSKVRSKIEHNFYIVKRLFGYRKTRYRGLAKNGARLYMLFALENILRWSWRVSPLGAPA
jgi:IS5 family transposase